MDALQNFSDDQAESFTEVTDKVGSTGTNGWWSSHFAHDIDGDGDIDLLAGNAGLNLQIKASPAAPVSLYAQDIDNDASVEPVLCYYIQGKSYPLPSRDELREQVPPLRKRFTSYALYTDATINELVGAEKLSKSLPAKSQHV